MVAVSGEIDECVGGQRPGGDRQAFDADRRVEGLARDADDRRGLVALVGAHLAQEIEHPRLVEVHPDDDEREIIASERPLRLGERMHERRPVRLEDRAEAALDIGPVGYENLLDHPRG